VIAAGDLTKDGKVEEFDAAQAWLDRLPRPRWSRRAITTRRSSGRARS
jgi:3',5'-cyclic AMP phosphodiesterase CpdA